MFYFDQTHQDYFWVEEDRLRVVDLNPEGSGKKPEVAAYTYDAGGERSIKYVPGRFDAFYSAKDAGNNHRLEAILYPNPLVTVKTLPLPEDPGELENVTLTKYTKHYYIGSERINSALGTIKSLGLLCEGFGADANLIAAMNNKVGVASEELVKIHIAFQKEITLPQLFLYTSPFSRCDKVHDYDKYAAYWYHPDHLGSSNYITNLDGEISQHMEYLPFGETLVEEHLNSNNSPYKFNAKEFDAETGNYYYGARYYDPKWSIWLSVDPLADHPKQIGISPYAYCANNPVIYVDPTGMLFDVVITGELSDKAVNQLNSSVEGQLKITRDESSGQLSYERTGEGPLTKDAQQLADAIDDRSVIVKVNASSSNISTVTGGSIIGGEFQGNTTTIDPIFGSITETHQQINPNQAEIIDKVSEEPGKITQHEVVESYLGGIEAQNRGLKSVPAATSADASNPNSVYKISHDNAPIPSFMPQVFTDYSRNQTYIKTKQGNRRYFPGQNDQ